MTIGIICAMPQEAKELHEAMDNATEEHIAECAFISGTLAGREVVLSRSGIGKVAAALDCALLIARYHADCVINSGSAGGLGSGLKIGDTVICTRAAHHDADLTTFGYPPGQMAGQELYFEADPTMVSKAEQAALALRGRFSGSIYRGTVLTGDQFVSNPQRKQELQKLFPDALAAEMEGAAIAQVCHQFRVPFLIIRAISDAAEEQNPMNFEDFLPLASHNSALLVRQLIEML